MGVSTLSTYAILMTTKTTIVLSDSYSNNPKSLSTPLTIIFREKQKPNGIINGLSNAKRIKYVVLFHRLTSRYGGDSWGFCFYRII